MIGLSEKLKNDLLIGAGILGALVFLFLIYSAIILLGDSFKTLDHLNRFENEIQEKNLTFPFPNMNDNEFLTIYEQRKNLYELDIQEFRDELEKNYIYTQEDYNCRYWTYVWADYWASNYIKNNWGFKVITTPNHVYAMIYNQSMYCVADQLNLNCQSLEN